MAKKKAQHLYELLGQKSREAKESQDVPGIVKLPGKEQEVPGQKEPSRRHVPAQYPPVATPAPVGSGQEQVLDNTITMRRDTAIVGALFLVVLLAVAFVLGRTTAPEAGKPNREGISPGLRGGRVEVLQLKRYNNDAEGRAEAENDKKLLGEKYEDYGKRARIAEYGDTLVLEIPGFEEKNDTLATKAYNDSRNLKRENGEKAFPNIGWK